MAKYYYKAKKKKRWTSILGTLLAIWLAITIATEYGPLAVFIVPVAIGYGYGYARYRSFLSSRKLFTKLRNEVSNPHLQHLKRLENLKESIKQVDGQLKLLDKYLSEKAFTQYGVLARQVLPKVEAIRDETELLKENMEPAIYNRISSKADTVIEDITTQLTALNLPVNMEQVDEQEERLQTLAPELLKTYRNIKIDHETILEKIKTADNQAELQAIHESNMKRFEDILTGYLKIKEAPKNFHNAEERLDLARQALEQFDLDLDQSLRELNESDLADFEISLRMIAKPNHDPLQDSTLD